MLPAHIKEHIIYSHQGLTYGGLLLSSKPKLAEVLAIFRTLLTYLNTQAIESLHLKIIPSFYTQQPSEELEYALHLCDAKLVKVETAAVISTSRRLPIQSNRMEGVKKARKHNLLVKEEPVFDKFWKEILIPNLKEKYQSKPTHSIEEIRSLQNHFPNNIRQFNVYLEEVLVGGATIFETKTTAHVQYISASKSKQILGTLDFLFYTLITEIFYNKPFFDFGTSNENNGKQLNNGLSFWKESFGARTLVQRQFTVQTVNHTLLDTILI